jgi:hypothetical protein
LNFQIGPIQFAPQFGDHGLGVGSGNLDHGEVRV